MLGKIDAIIFTADIGENDARVREAVCSGLEIFGIRMDKDKNSAPQTQGRWVGLPETRVRIIIVPDEELAIAEDTQRIIKSKFKG